MFPDGCLDDHPSKQCRLGDKTGKLVQSVLELTAVGRDAEGNSHRFRRPLPDRKGRAWNDEQARAYRSLNQVVSALAAGQPKPEVVAKHVSGAIEGAEQRRCEYLPCQRFASDGPGHVRQCAIHYPTACEC